MRCFVIARIQAFTQTTPELQWPYEAIKTRSQDYLAIAMGLIITDIL